MLIETHHETTVPFMKFVTILYDKPKAELREVLKRSKPVQNLTYKDSVCDRIISFNRKAGKDLGLLKYNNFNSISLGEAGEIYSVLENFKNGRRFYKEPYSPIFKVERVDQVFFANLLLKDKLIKELLSYLSTHKPTRWELYKACVTFIFPKIYGEKAEKWKTDWENTTATIIRLKSYHKFRHVICPRLNLLEEVGIVERKGKKRNFVYSIKRKFAPFSTPKKLIYEMCSFCKPGTLTLKDLVETYRRFGKEVVESEKLIQALFFRLIEREEFMPLEEIRKMVYRFQFMHPNQILWFKKGNKSLLSIEKDFYSKEF